MLFNYDGPSGCTMFIIIIGILIYGFFSWLYNLISGFLNWASIWVPLLVIIVVITFIASYFTRNKETLNSSVIIIGAIVFIGTLIYSLFGTPPSFLPWVEKDKNSYVVQDNYTLSAVASSTYPDNGSITYGANNLIDNDYSTAWVENVPGAGEGESFTIFYDGTSPTTIYSINILNGYVKSEEAFATNNSVSNLTIDYNGQPIVNLQLEDSGAPQSFTLEQPITMNSGDNLTFHINSVYQHAADYANDTAITEIWFN